MQWVQTALHQHAEQEALSGFGISGGSCRCIKRVVKGEKAVKLYTFWERSLHGEGQNSTRQGEGQHVLISNVRCNLLRIRKSGSSSF